jgi:cardiolipin synthase
MNLTVPNLLSLLRIGLIPFFVVALLQGRPAQALAVFCVAGVTDLVDGLIARFFGQQSLLGAYLDPIADKLLLMTAYVMLAVPGLHSGMQVPLWVAALVLTRDVVVVVVVLVFYLALGLRNFPPSWLSKVNTAAQIAAVILVLASGMTARLLPAARWVVYLVALSTLASGTDYVFKANRLAAHRG